MPYLTLRDKISQNLALLKVDSHKKFESHRIFISFKNTFYKEIIINHTLLCLSQVSYIKIKAIWLFWGSSKVIFVKISQNFIKSPLKIWFISQISVHSLWHVCMYDGFRILAVLFIRIGIGMMDLEFLLYLFIRIELQVEKSPSSLVLYHFVGSESSISADPVVMTRRITAQVSMICFSWKNRF